MSNSLHSVLTRIGDVTIERVIPCSDQKAVETGVEKETPVNVSMNNKEQQVTHDDSSEDSSGETSDAEQERKHDIAQSEDIEEIHSGASGDDMDLDETIDSQIGVRMESERQQAQCLVEDDDEEPVDILDTLPLEGAPIEGQEVSEADLLGKPLSKDSDDDVSLDSETTKSGGRSRGDDGVDDNKRHADSDGTDNAKKKYKKDDGTEGSASECETKAEKKLANMRRNIREVMDETQLEEATLSAQRQEMERLRRVQEQQRIIREVQRQIAINRQNNKTQTRVISLLQGKQNQAGTTISQSTSASVSPSSTHVRLPSTVLLKVNSGSGNSTGQTTTSAQSSPMHRRPTDATRWQKGRGIYQGAQTSISRVSNRSSGSNMLQQRIRMMTPSVSISPVVPKKEPMDSRSEYYSDSDVSDIETEEDMREKQLHGIRKTSSCAKAQKPTKGKDVVTISSSSESSDDDCIVLSDPSGEEETDNEDDPSNSGMHTNDRYNIPDEHGRVLINVGHPETEPDVFLAPQVARIIKPHQIGGIRFLFDNIVESIERYKTSSGFGCILAHSMGLGKTLQVASFCDIFFRCTTARTVLCIMPINTLQNWLAEFNMWLPYEDSNSEKLVKSANIKLEPGIEPKAEIKEESGNQNDMSNVTRPISAESVHHLGQDNASQPLNMIPENPYTHQGYQPRGMMHGCMQDSTLNKHMPDSNAQVHQGYQPTMSQNPLYSTSRNPPTNFDHVMKQEVNCHGMPNRSNVTSGTKFGMDGQNPSNMCPGMDNRPHGGMYPDLENRHPTGVYPDVHQSTYPTYNNSSAHSMPLYNLPPSGQPTHSQLPVHNASQQNPAMHNQPPHNALSRNPSLHNPLSSFPNYANRQTQGMERDVKKEMSLPPQSANVNIKKEPEEPTKKEEGTCTSNEDPSDDKKDIEKVKTPYSVDAPIGMEMRPRHFRLHILNDSHKTMTARAKVIQEWQTSGGVLLIGYELYRQLSLKKPNKAKRKRGQPSFKDTVDVEEEDKNKGLLDEMHTALVSPGPDLVICDEGHRIKNSHASISMALKQMRTKRRIVLTGYPLQNNLLEYWCMVDFVRPNYLGTKSEFCNMFERPIQNGQCIDSTPQDIRLMRYRAHVLHALLEGFVQRRSHSVLQVSLPRKEEYILLVRMTPHQRKLYDTFMNQVVKTRAVPNPLKAFAVCCKIWNHPDILYHFLRKRQANEEDDLDLEETITEKTTAGGKRSKARQPKGESKKGKKTNTTIKNKPAASVQPNASATTNTENTDGDVSHNNPKQGSTFTNYSMPMQDSGYSNTMPHNSYSQNYQNYRTGDQNAYYRNDNGHGEYNEFYNNQGQQRYGNQSFQTYPSTQNYNSVQTYPNQQQNYVGTNEQSVGHQQGYPSAAPTSEFRPDQGQNQTNNYDTPGMFARQPYPYQDQSRNYTPTMNQNTNYSQVQNQSSFPPQIPNQSTNIPVSDYSSAYPATNQNQNYQTPQNYPRNETQSLTNSNISYPNQPNPNTAPQTPGYIPNQQGQNQQNQTIGLQNSGHTYPSSQQSQNINVQNQSHGYGTQVGSNPPSQSTLSFNQQNPNSIPQNQTHNYMNNQPTQTPIPQNPMRGYTPGPQNQMVVPPQSTAGYSSNQNVSGTAQGQGQTHVYGSEQQGPGSNVQSSIHGYGHIMSSSNSQNQSSTYPSALQTQGNSQSGQNIGYAPNRQGPTTLPQNTTNRYATGHHGQISQSTNQPLNYPSSQQNVASTQNERLYPRSDGQPQAQNYAPPANAPHDFPADHPAGNSSVNSGAAYSSNAPQNQAQPPIMPNYSSDNARQHQINAQIKGSEDPYWQRNYSQSFRSDQCNDQYYRESNSNRYQNNYFPSQGYSSQSYEYSSNQTSDTSSRSDETKPSQPGGTAHGTQNMGTCEKNSSDITSSIPTANQSMHQNAPSQGFANESNCQNSGTSIPKAVAQGLGSSHSPRSNHNDSVKEEEKEKEDTFEKDKEEKSDDEILTKDEEKECKSSPGGKDDPGIPYDWATELMKGYVPGLIDASAKMTLFFCILEEAIRLGDRVLAFSQSLFTLNLIEDFLARNGLKYPDGQTDAWIKNVNYYRLDGSTSALEREKLINEFNNNAKIHLFLVSTRAGSLGINLVGANRAIVFDASWNPCHDTQAVCRVYRYGQQKPCFVYRLVTDNCLERKIYDRQISKQGMADRVVDQCNPDAHLSLKEATTLSWDWEEDSQVQDFSQTKDSYSDEVMHRVLERHSSLLTKQPFHHESLLVDRKDKKLSQAEKRLARRGYELEKMAANCSRPSYNYVPGNTATRGGLQIRAIRGGEGGTTPKPVASVRPMQQRGAEGLNSRGVTGSRWIPAEVWQRQGMSAQEMTLPLDVVIPTNSPDKGSIVLKAGQRVMVLKSPKGIYMQLESGKIIAIRTALKLNQQKREEELKKGLSSMVQRNSKSEVGFPLRNNSAISIIPKSSSSNQSNTRPFNKPGSGGAGYRPFVDKEVSKRPKPIATATAKPYLSQVNLTNQVSLQRLSKVKSEPMDNSNLGENSNSSDSQLRTEQRVEEVRLEDVVAEVSSNTDYSPSNQSRTMSSDTESSLQKSSEENTQTYTSENKTTAQGVQTQHDHSGHSDLPLKDDKHCSTTEEKEHAMCDNGKTEQTFARQAEKADNPHEDVIIEEPTPSVPHTPAATSVQNQSAPETCQPVHSVDSIPIDHTKNLSDSASVPVASVCTGTNTTAPPKEAEPTSREQIVRHDSPNVPQGYPYAQYPRYYEYTDPRSRSTLSNPYGTYFSGVSPHTGGTRLPVSELTNAQADLTKQVEDIRVPPHIPSARLPVPELLSKSGSDVIKSTEEQPCKSTANASSVYSQVSTSTAKTLVNTVESKGTDPVVTTTVAGPSTREDTTHMPTAFTHPSNARYAGPYPPGPYDPYSQHYPPAPGAAASYPPTGAPGYPTYGAPAYNTDYARMYSAFHGPPSAADPYMHRGYAPPSSHPPNYYPPFPHPPPPPPPYPNYSFLPPYPNPNVPGDPQPPTQ